MAEVDDAVKTVVDLTSNYSDRRIPAGSYGTIVEKYDHPEGYAVDVLVAEPELVGGYSFEHLVLTPGQFVAVPEIPRSVFDGFADASDGDPN